MGQPPTMDPPGSPEPPDREKPAAVPAEVPAAPRLEPARVAFAAGDFRRARHLSEEVLGGQPTAEESAQANEILQKLRADPWAIRIGILALVLLVTLTAVYIVPR